MKKVILVFAIFMAFIVKSFAYSEYSLSLDYVGTISETINMPDCTEAYYAMGCSRPGYVELYLIDINDQLAYSDRYDWGGWSSGTNNNVTGQFSYAYIKIAVYSHEHDFSGYTNGILLIQY